MNDKNSGLIAQEAMPYIIDRRNQAMSYVRDNLMPNEKVLFTARIHPAVFLPSVVTFILAIALVIYGLSTASIVGKAGSSPQITVNAMMGSVLLCSSVILFVYAVLLVFQAIIVMFTTEFAITNRRVVAKTGFIRRHTLEMLLAKVESVSVNQNILGRLLNFGTVTVTGTGGTKESFRAIVEPIGVRKKINQIIENYMQAYTQFQQQKSSAPQAGG
jgi:uncharacterized membrane protein YdbT with pleckstrin-like domain